MTYDSWAVDMIEQTEREQPQCAACGAPTVPVAQGGVIWLACSHALEPKSFLRRLVALDALTGHTRRAIMNELEYGQVA